ncbi:hypothetical protein RF55_1110 [Lasius niger]|uniref:Uncharacterized protein n=1 Tax=Lasius niger TaxID=67767 RepID=A0A0J7L7E6_LASNI|nr:hypothetical protein RF55_1110 [Lasius niger]
MGEGGRERGEGLINGRRHAPENIAGREGRKSGETARGRQERWREVRRGDRTRSGGENGIGRPQLKLTGVRKKDVDGSYKGQKMIKKLSISLPKKTVYSPDYIDYLR